MGQAPSLLEVVKTCGTDKGATIAVANILQQYKNQIDINAANDDGKTALHIASELGQADVVLLLLEHGADPSKTDNQLCTPLMNAVFIGNTQTTEALLSNGKSDINAVNKDGMTSLHWAILRRHYECVQLLIKHGANTELKNAKGQTPLDMIQTLKPKQRAKMEDFVKQCMAGGSPAVPASSMPPTPSKSGSNTTTRSNSISGAQIAASTKSSHVRKLFALCKVWGLVKFIHPYFIHKDIDWDEALVNTIPKMIAAENTQEYKQVVNQLLSVLGDPNTRCSEAEETVRASPDANANPDREQPYTSLTEDGIAVFVATAHDKFQDYSRMLNFLNCFKELSPILSPRSSHAIIFDLRLRKGGVPLNTAAGPFKYMFFEAMKIILTQDIHLPCYRQRVFSGFPQQRNFGNIFQSGVLTLEGETLAPPVGMDSSSRRDDRSHRKWIFIINKGTPDCIIDLLSALQPEGLAAVIYDKHDKEPLIELGIPSIQINIGDNLSVTVRKSERLNFDGTVGFQPDVVIHSAPQDTDAAMQSALEIARGVKKVDFAKRPTSPLYIKKPVEQEYGHMSIPSKEYRLLGLFRFWNIVQYFYPYKNLLDREWDEVLAEFIPKMEEAESSIDYALTVAELVSNIKDSHGNCSSALLSNYIGTHIPPVEVKFIEGQTVITHIFDPAVKQAHDIRLGDVVISVNGEQIEARRNRLARIMSASTPQALQWKIHQKVLAGEKDSAVELEIYTPGATDAAAHPRKIPLTRNMLPVAKSPTRPSYAILPEGYGFIDTVTLNPFEVEKALETIKETPALILDIRGYPKGTIYAIAPRLTAKKVDVAITQTPYLQPSMLYSELESCVIEETHKLQPSAGWKYKGKVVVLINEETISHAEHSCLYLEAATDVTFVGTPTNGANGNVTNCYLPGGILVAFTGLGTQHADKGQLQRKGIQPHIRVDTTAEAVKNSQDIVLDAAVRYLKNHFAIKEVANADKNNNNAAAVPTSNANVEAPKSPATPKTPTQQPGSQNGTPTTQRKL